MTVAGSALEKEVDWPRRVDALLSQPLDVDLHASIGGEARNRFAQIPPIWTEFCRRSFAQTDRLYFSRFEVATTGQMTPHSESALLREQLVVWLRSDAIGVPSDHQ
jgi:hypothetical protein